MVIELFAGELNIKAAVNDKFTFLKVAVFQIILPTAVALYPLIVKVIFSFSLAPSSVEVAGSSPEQDKEP